MLGFGIGIVPTGKSFLSPPTNLNLSIVGSSIRATWTDAANAPNGYKVLLDGLQVDTVSQGVGTVDIPFNVASNLDIDFNDYISTTQLMADSAVWNLAEDHQDAPAGGIGRIILDADIAPVGYSKSMRYDYEHPDDGCNSITVGRSLQFPGGQVQEAWGHFLVRWTPNFTTANAVCPPNDHKLLFGDTVADQSGRWGLYVGNGVPGDLRLKVERPTATGGTGPYALNIDPTFDATTLWDGIFHSIKLYTRHSTTTTSADSYLKLWVDNVLLHSETGFNTVKPVIDGGGVDRMTGYSFTHNKDDGPPNILMSIWWGWIKSYLTDPGW